MNSFGFYDGSAALLSEDAELGFSSVSFIHVCLLLSMPLLPSQNERRLVFHEYRNTFYDGPPTPSIPFSMFHTAQGCVFRSHVYESTHARSTESVALYHSSNLL